MFSRTVKQRRAFPPLHAPRAASPGGGPKATRFRPRRNRPRAPSHDAGQARSSAAYFSLSVNRTERIHDTTLMTTEPISAALNESIVKT